MIEVYRVASFYKAFRLKTGRENCSYHVPGNCLSCPKFTASTRPGDGQLGVQPGEVTPDGLFSIECVNCLGACAMGPIVKENEIYHHHMTPDKLRTHRRDSTPSRIGGEEKCQSLIVTANWNS